ncbi:hypothetical protein [Desulfitibacter alkalitolerans]|uniref:hypothetical protein n=1 Tax=Desulfitibacter alkalitolerans TaxID=264641 RepID=UPI000486F725|nr:hypothetical protein [Desulfitibacter alkalitolerans]
MSDKDEALTPLQKPLAERPQRSVEEVQQLKNDVASEAEITDLQRISKLDEVIDKGIELLTDKDKLAKANLKDIGIVVGIMLDKKKETLESRIGKKQQNISLRVAWKNGGGAVELKTGE